MIIKKKVLVEIDVNGFNTYQCTLKCEWLTIVGECSYFGVLLNEDKKNKNLKIRCKQCLKLFGHC